jgi:hypothetical protein
VKSLSRGLDLHTGKEPALLLIKEDVLMNKIRMIRIILMTIGAFSLISFSMCDDLQDLTGDIDNQYTPMLLSPPPGIFFDNGCSDRSDTIQWDFDWSDVTGATQYQIYVIHEGSQYPALDTTVSVSEYSYRMSDGYITDRNRTNWTWKVRAGNAGVWGEWSEIGYYDVEPLNTDCN